MNSSKHIFELSAEEQSQRMRNRIAEVQQNNLDAGLYNIFLYPDVKDQRIRKYADHTDIVTINETTGQSRVVKRISR